MIMTFVGSPDGMTPKQRVRIAARLEHDPLTAVHHGAVEGADDQFHKLALLYQIPEIHLYPPVELNLMMDLTAAESIPSSSQVLLWPPKPDTDRFKYMAGCGDVLIATPPDPAAYSSRRERWRRWENVWRAIHYAEAIGTPVHIVYTDGTIEVRNP